MIDQEEIHNQCLSEDPKERIKALVQLESDISLMPNKEKAWDDLNKLATSKNNHVNRVQSILSILSTPLRIMNQLLKDMTKLIDEGKLNSNEDRLAYIHLCQELTRNLTLVFWSTYVDFSFLSPDKQDAWSHLILINRESSYVRYKAACALGSAFSQVPNKQQAWIDLHKLTTNEDSQVRRGAVYAIGSAFSQVLDKDQAWNSLIKLTNDEDEGVRAYSNYSLGKVSIFKASRAENEENYKKELEKAIAYFEKVKTPSHLLNPSQFCLPFYRSFHTIIFKKREAKEEVDKYLEEAKGAIEGSKSKELLFEAVDNLANALKEVQNLENMKFEVTKGQLDFYRKYCDHAAELMIDVEEAAPFATIALRKGLPILDRNLKELLAEIQKKAKVACKESKGTATEEITCTVYSEIQTWEIGSQEEMAFNVENLIFTLESSVPRIPENQYIFNRIQQVREQKDIPKQYGIISTIIPLIPKLYMGQTVGELKNDIKEIKEKVDYVIISLKPGIKEEIEISVGTEILGTGVTHKITIPLQEISYSELKEDLEKITGIKIDKLSKMPKRLANKVKGYLLLHDKDDILEKLI